MVVCIQSSALLIAELAVPLCGFMTIRSIHPLVHEHLGYFQSLAIANKAAVNIWLLWTCVLISSRQIPRSEMAGSHGKLMFHFLRNCQTIRFDILTSRG